METTSENEQTLSAPGDAIKLWEFPIQGLSEARFRNLTRDESNSMLPTEGD